jgi:hypothetical protein
MEWQHICASPADKYKQNMQMYVGTLRKNFRGSLLRDSFLFFASKVHNVKAVIL